MITARPLLEPGIVAHCARGIAGLDPLVELLPMGQELLSRAPRTCSELQQAIFTLGDGGRMHLNVTPSGTKLWRPAYRFDGKEKL